MLSVSSCGTLVQQGVRLFCFHTNGASNASTLAAEAGVSRQDLYHSYRALLEEFRSHLRRIEESGAPADRRGAELRRLGDKLSQTAARAARYRPSGMTLEASATPTRPEWPTSMNRIGSFDAS